MDTSNGRPTGIIPHSRPTVGPAEGRAAAAVIESAQIAQGAKVREFEQRFSAKHGAGDATACSSGTAALHLALMALGVHSGQEVIIPSYVCTALLNAVRYTGATPVVSDINSRSYNLDPDAVRAKMSRRTAAIIVPHMFGLPADVSSLSDCGVPLIEDCAQALGSTADGSWVGTRGQLAICSFYATKVITCGEGGMVVSRSKGLTERVRDLRDYDGRDDDKVRYNYKMTDIQAAVGLCQLDRLDEFIQRRRFIAGAYDAAFGELPMNLPVQAPGHIYYRYVIDTRRDAGEVIRKLGLKNIRAARPVGRPLHRHLGLDGYAGTETAWRSAVSLPIYPSLSEEDLHRIIDVFWQLNRKS